MGMFWYRYKCLHHGGHLKKYCYAMYVPKKLVIKCNHRTFSTMLKTPDYGNNYCTLSSNTILESKKLESSADGVYSLETLIGSHASYLF